MRSVGDVLYNYLQDVQSVLAPGIASAFLLGICWKRASAKGGMWGLLSGIIIGLTRLGAKVYYSNVTDPADNWFKAIFYDFNWLYFCGVMLVFCCLVVVWSSAPLLPSRLLPHVHRGPSGMSSTASSFWVLLLPSTIISGNHWR